MMMMCTEKRAVVCRRSDTLRGAQTRSVCADRSFMRWIALVYQAGAASTCSADPAHQKNSGCDTLPFQCPRQTLDHLRGPARGQLRPRGRTRWAQMSPTGSSDRGRSCACSTRTTLRGKNARTGKAGQSLAASRQTQGGKTGRRERQTTTARWKKKNGACALPCKLTYSMVTTQASAKGWRRVSAAERGRPSRSQCIERT